MPIDWIYAMVGGLIIGLSVSIMLLFNGRVTGIAGIIYGLFNPVKGDWGWRWYFLSGLVLGGLIMSVVKVDAFSSLLNTNWIQLLMGGFLIGFGSVLGSGCTSGHGVCGISRLSPRSLVATMIFMSSGILTVYFLRKFGLL